MGASFWPLKGLDLREKKFGPCVGATQTSELSRACANLPV